MSRAGWSATHDAIDLGDHPAVALAAVLDVGGVNEIDACFARLPDYALRGWFIGGTTEHKGRRSKAPRPRLLAIGVKQPQGANQCFTPSAA